MSTDMIVKGKFSHMVATEKLVEAGLVPNAGGPRCNTRKR
jgi:hypothetical protein